MTAAFAATSVHDIDLSRGLQSLGLSLSDEACAKLRQYIELLAKWNRTYNLTAIREPAQMVTHHLLDSLAVLAHLPQQASGLRVLDVGAGGGLPGIPLAIARPRWDAVLIDSNHKKAAFLTQVAIELALPNVRIVPARVENFADAAPFDIVISRAFADLRTFAQLGAKHVAPNGRLYAMKGTFPGDEIATLPPGIEVVDAAELHVPGVEAARHLIVMRKRATR